MFRAPEPVPELEVPAGMNLWYVCNRTARLLARREQSTGSGRAKWNRAHEFNVHAHGGARHADAYEHSCWKFYEGTRRILFLWTS